MPEEIDQSTFTNPWIDSQSLPAIEEEKFTGLEQDYLYMRITSRLIFFILIGGVGTLITVFQGFTLWYWLVPWLFLFAFSVTVEILGFRIKGYAIRQKDVSYKSGLIFYHMTSIPFNRIQHCEISQGPLGRLFDLASVKVYTAGGSSSDLSINGLHKERAQRLRDYITKLSAEYE